MIVIWKKNSLRLKVIAETSARYTVCKEFGSEVTGRFSIEKTDVEKVSD